LHVHVDGVGALTARTEGEFGLHHGEQVYLTPDPSRIHRFDASGAVLR
jgi:multiple sugar transport system ATP-binding protein